MTTHPDLITYRCIPWTSLLSASIDRRSCFRCQRDILRGERCWRPLREGNGVVRTDRLCSECGRMRANA
jgi:hypothetical protein